MDRMHIRDLAVECIIGTKPEERVTKQTVVINLTLECDLTMAGRTDNLEDTVNYVVIKRDVIALIEQGKFLLIERMADRIAEICFANRRVSSVTVTIDKPGAIPEARSVAVEIHRTKDRRLR